MAVIGGNYLLVKKMWASDVRRRIGLAYFAVFLEVLEVKILFVVLSLFNLAN